ncbi:histidine phosphatase family protein [Halobacillus seohaensis]|uniref:Histidine phosphatase family protein n=1 Tax=Halobacillus seohaensis TaxID=447421 RepID=A0ABW2ETT2_9BACI
MCKIHTFEKLAWDHYCQAWHFERLKRSSLNQPLLFNHYMDQQDRHLVLAHRCNIIAATTRKSYVDTNRQSILSLLRDGGYVLYARHAEATIGEDQPNFDLQDCSTQRNLSETGRKQAEMYGQTFRQLRIPVEDPVLASPFCRSRETAVLAFGEDNIQVDPFWMDVYWLSGDLNSSEQQAIVNNLNSRLETQPSVGTNTLIIAHNFPEGVGLGQISNMGTVVLKPKGQGNGYEYVTQLSLDEWVGLSE